MSALVGRERRNGGAEQLNLTRIRPHFAADLVEQGRLASAIRADDQAPLAGPYRERYVLCHRKSAEGFVQADDLKSKRGHRDLPRIADVSLYRPGTIPVGITMTIIRNTRPNSMFHRSMYAEA